MSFDNSLLIATQQKWSNILNIDISIKQIQTVFHDIHCLNEDVYIRNVNFKILHRRMVTNKILKTTSMKEPDLCELCEDKSETQEYALFECIYTRAL